MSENIEEKVKRNRGLEYKIPLWSILGIVGLFSVTWGTLNSAKYAIYETFYDIRHEIGNIPGINDGFTPQGICIDEKNNVFLLTGYQTNINEASRIYITGENYKPRYVEMIGKDNKPYCGHNGGIAVTNDNVFIADTNGKVHLLSLSEILNKENSQVKIKRTINLKNNEADFIFTNDDTLIVGEFSYSDKGFICHNANQTHDGVYTAIAEQYNINDFLSDNLPLPEAAYSIKDKIQGLAMDEKGNIVLSSSYSINDSHFYYYQKDNFTQADHKHKNTVDLYYLDKPDKILKAPAMSEDMDYTIDPKTGKGYFISYTEAACDKYFFGKLFFADYFYGFNWDN